MILIADGGSTKTSWCLLEDNGQNLMFETEGYHPFFVDEEYIFESLNKNTPKEVREKASGVTEVCIYSAGGGYSTESDNILINGVGKIFQNANIVIETDLLASARALLGRNAGVAAILGTGSNSCLYDGKKITANIESLGFLLGDEGSGAYMGKRLISDFIRKKMPNEIREAFYDTYKLSDEELIEKVYSDPTPNRYCASFTFFLSGEFAGNEYIERVKKDCFVDFFKNIISGYSNYSDYPFNCVGSIGWVFRNTLEEAANDFGMKIGNIIKSPMEGLLIYHTTQK